ncbi:MAG: T9SS type A sorting domain-containing protein [Flavobacteriales bacterium]
MKNLYLLLLGMLCFSISQSQVDTYHPYPQNEGFWSYTHIDGTDGSETYRTSLWAGDTLINDVAYLKRNPNEAFFAGAIRQDIENEKLYFLDSDHVEHDISIDQQVQVGEVLTFIPEVFEVLFASSNWIDSSIDLEVIEVGSIEIGSSERRQLLLAVITEEFSGIGFTYIAGVGIQDITILNAGQNLSCFFDNGLLLFGDEFNPACSYNSVIEATESELSVYPNPTSKMLNIEIPSGFQNASYEITDLTGSIIKRGSMNSGLQQVDVSLLSNGLYTFKLTKGLVVSTAMFVVDQ